MVRVIDFCNKALKEGNLDDFLVNLNSHIDIVVREKYQKVAELDKVKDNSIGTSENQSSSIWWRRGLFFILLVEFVVLIWVTTGSYYRDSQPPIPEKVIDHSGHVIFTGTDIQSGQEVFLKKGLMNNGSIWGHGAYLGLYAKRLGIM